MIAYIEIENSRLMFMGTWANDDGIVWEVPQVNLKFNLTNYQKNAHKHNKTQK